MRVIEGDGTRKHGGSGRRARGALLVATSVLLFWSALAASTCESAPPRGHGLIEFGGGAHSSVLDDPNALGINPLFNWADLEPAPGQFNWAPIDAALGAARARGKRVVPRVYTNVGDFGQATPQWVFDAGAEAYRFGGSDTPQPLPTDPVFTQTFGAFLGALGARYDGHADIEFFQTNAGMGGYGEMVWSYGDAAHPPGWSPDVEIDTIAYWLDRWRGAFPRTSLALMVNPIETGIAESVARYAVDRGFYLQSNTLHQSAAALRIFSEHAGRTRIVLEIENNGCRGATGVEFDAVASQVFGYGFPIDYLSICAATFADAGRAQAMLDRLRKAGG